MNESPRHKRPTISLAVIAKNEAENIKQFFDSIEGCFDEVHFTDTGSTDKTVELAEARGAIIHRFNWIEDFSAARNYSFSHVTTDYVAWLDLDDVLENPEGFKAWRDEAMGLADYWLATYHYASDSKTGKPICSFARERVFKTSLGLSWKYFLHEGVIAQSPFGMEARVQYIPTWAVRHKRTDADLEKDRSRNLRIFEANKGTLDSRMQYYYGKELFEAGRPGDAIGWLTKAASLPDLELHDRILAIQFAAYAYMQCNQWSQAIGIALTGLQIAPSRAEYHMVIADCYAKQNKLAEAIPFLNAAKTCVNQLAVVNGMAGPIFSHEDAYGVVPRTQLAKIYAHLGQWDKSEAEALDAMRCKPSPEASALLEEITKVKKFATNFDRSQPCEDIVITAPFPTPYEWDSEIAKTKGVGGSETAAIHMASWLHKLTGRQVHVFNMRSQTKVIDGVRYRPFGEMGAYFQEYKPWAHIAWRHNMKVTDARTFYWCHDLVAAGGENVDVYEKLLCLTPFHSRYAQIMQGIPASKIQITRNGIDPSRFETKEKKNVNKIVFPSSPDRGLDRAMRIIDRVIDKYPDLELHVFYGFDNLRKFGLSAMADKLEGMIKERPWVKYHGNVQQDVLATHFKEAAIWLHPANFIETFCITAIEMLCSGTYSVTRRLGALQDTLAEAERTGMATLLDIDCETESEYDTWAKALVDALERKAWEQVKVDPRDFSWESVAHEWLSTFLSDKKT